MAKKMETLKLITSLKEATKETKKSFFSDIAERLEGSRRQLPSINVAKINSLAAKNKGKTIVVPGKILSDGEMTEKATVVALSASALAKEKIRAKGEFISMKEFANKAKTVKVSEMIIVK